MRGWRVTDRRRCVYEGLEEEEDKDRGWGEGWRTEAGLRGGKFVVCLTRRTDRWAVFQLTLLSTIMDCEPKLRESVRNVRL